MKIPMGRLFVLAWLLAPLRGAADDPTEARVREAFAKAWQAKHDTATDRDELAVRLYREAWPGLSVYATSFSRVMKVKPFPEDATADSILRGEHGDASTWRLWDLTEEICLDLFTERPAAVIKVLAADFAGEAKSRRRAHDVLWQWQRRLHRNVRLAPGGGATLPEPARHVLEQLAQDLFPVVSRRYAELEAAGELELGPLAYALRNLDDPRAIPLLLGKDGRGVRHFELLRTLQRNRKADPNLTKLLADEDSQVRWRAAYALAECGDGALAPRASKLLRDPDAQVRREGLSLAYFLLSPERTELDADFKALLRDPDWGVRQSCAILLAQRKDAACAPTLLDLLRNEKIDMIPHGNLVGAMQNLTGDLFGYHYGSDAWQPTTPNNRAAIEKFAAWIASLPDAGAKPQPSILTSPCGPAPGDKPRILFEEEDFKFAAVDFGRHEQPQVPGFYAFAKKSSAWIRIDKVSTKGGVFGRSPTDDELRGTGQRPLAVGWNFRRLKDDDHVALPLQGGSFIAFPDQIAFDAEGKQYVLSFHSQWGIEAVRTVLKFGRADLLAAFEKGGPKARTDGEKK